MSQQPFQHQYKLDAETVQRQLIRQLRITDQILAPQVENVKLVSAGVAPAWTEMDNSTICFNEALLPTVLIKNSVGLDYQGIAIWMGLNIHELGHIFWTTRNHEPLGEMVASVGHLWIYLNILEDLRNERLLAARSHAWRSILNITYQHYRQQAIHRNRQKEWVLVSGRTWLPNNIRQEARLNFFDQTKVTAVAHCIGNYQRLSDPAQDDADRAFELIEELYVLTNGQTPDPIYQHNHTLRNDPIDSTPADTNRLPAADETNDSNEQSESNKPDDNNSGSSDNDDSSSDNTASDDNDDNDEQSLEDALKDVESVINNLLKTKIGVSSGDPNARHKTIIESPTPDGLKLRKELTEKLRRVTALTDPGWHKRVDNGRLNIRRWYTDRDPETAFDQWNAGTYEATDWTVVVLIDLSGSMGFNIAPMQHAAWALDHAFYSNNIEAHIGYYESTFYPMREQRIPYKEPHIFYAAGGTAPGEGLNWATDKLYFTQSTHKILLSMTDGQWDQEDKRKLQHITYTSNGITTLSFILDTDGYVQAGHITKDRNGHVLPSQNELVSDDLMDLPRWLTDNVLSVIRGDLVRANIQP